MSKFDKLEKEFDVQITNYAKWPTHSDPHFHNGYELYYLFFGSTKYIVENITAEINEGDIVWIPPYIDHKTRPNNVERHKRMLFYISTEFFEDCLKDNKELFEFFHHFRIIRTTSGDVQRFRRYANLLLEEHFAHGLPMSDTVIKGLLISLLVHLKRMYDRNIKQQSQEPDDGEAPSYTLNLLLSHINTNFSQELTLASLAEQVNMNPVYISSLFKKNFGFTFKEYLLKLRIEKATSLLKESNSTVENIALECGFSSSNHFCKTFKKLMGMSPMMFRNIEKE
ncbi:MAG: AraC family transcriptional regulator [Clostridia bacterium]|nr:AraC family transcriptional regulator [Clostridia bacterium]